MSGDGTAALIGAPDANPIGFPGEAYLFTRTEAGWNTDNPVVIPNPADDAFYDDFGGRVALNGDGTTALVSALNRGEAYLFTRTAEGWDIDNPVILSNPEPDDNDRFGVVGMNADATTLLIGAPEERSNGDVDVGAAYLHEQETQSLISKDHASRSDTLAEQRGGIREWIRRHRHQRR